MENKDLIFKDEFLKSKEFNEWHESYVSAINHALEPTKEFIWNWEEKYGKLPKLQPIKDNDHGLLRLKKKS